mgnify:CR=1 FL=1
MQAGRCGTDIRGAGACVLGARSINRRGTTLSLSTRIDAIARSAARTDADSPPGLVALRDALTSIQDLEEITSHDGARTMLGEAIKALEHVVLRDTDSPETELAKVHDTIDFLQDLVEATASGLNAPEPPRGPGWSGEVDPELFSAWVSSSEDTLNEIEAQVLALVSKENGADAVDEIRRRIHTIKGECGVVSAHSMQALFHEAESAIDRASEAGERFPTDEILELVDWSRRQLERATPESPSNDEGHDALLARLRECGAGGASTKAAPQTDAPGEALPEPADSTTIFPPRAASRLSPRTGPGMTQTQKFRPARRTRGWSWSPRTTSCSPSSSASLVSTSAPRKRRCWRSRPARRTRN